MKIRSHTKDYEVFIENDKGFIDKILKTENAFVVVDSKVFEIYNGIFDRVTKNRLYLIDAEEKNKVIDTALEICEKMTEISAKRNAVLISFGGGIVQDITGFSANILYRGIKWIFVPTTLLAACDSCIGGKTSLNYKKYKNLLGTFYAPDEIHIYTEWFDSLTRKDYESGLGEVLKFNIMQGQEGLENIERDFSKIIERDPKIVSKYVLSSLEFKKKFIEADEYDRNERIKLNFAHTFGHAIEVVSEYVIPHGTAVAIGMIMANYVSYKRNYIAEDVMTRSEKVLLKVIDIDIDSLRVPKELFLKAIMKDKKQTGDAITIVIISEYGIESKLSVVHDSNENEICTAIDYFIQLYGKNNEN